MQQDMEDMKTWIWHHRRRHGTPKKRLLQFNSITAEKSILNAVCTCYDISLSAPCTIHPNRWSTSRPTEIYCVHIGRVITPHSGKTCLGTPLCPPPRKRPFLLHGGHIQVLRIRCFHPKASSPWTNSCPLTHTSNFSAQLWDDARFYR